MTAWLDCFLKDPTTGRAPARDFLGGLPPKVAAEFVAIVMAVRDAPPPAFRGGGKWEAMHDVMAGFYEIRARHGGTLHRLFCVLDRSTKQPTLLMISGGSKPNNTTMDQAVYAEAIRLRRLWHEAVAAGKASALLDCGE